MCYQKFCTSRASEIAVIFVGTQVEKPWERDYETYFNENLADFSITAEGIAETLSNLSEETGTKPAVIWVYTRLSQYSIFFYVIISRG
ncbi:MAG: hypothetical protein AB4080_14510 [Trichodesmium sp.]